jgi:hypothetical protein
MKNFCDLGESPNSIYAFHNRFFRQIRDAFVMNAFYPALTAACALGERLLNHLLIAVRESYKGRPEYRHVYRKKSFADWKIPIETLLAWKVLGQEAADAFQTLREIRNKTLHFNPEIDHDDRNMAMLAIQTLGRIISRQFAASGDLPWFIPNTSGASFLKKTVENDPFIKAVYIPQCVLVGPRHRLEMKGNGWGVIDIEYPDSPVTDIEFVELLNNKRFFRIFLVFFDWSF